MFFSITAVRTLTRSPPISSLATGGFEEIFRSLAAVIFKALKQNLAVASTEHGNTVNAIARIIGKEFDEEP